jgi:hypothetical protein
MNRFSKTFTLSACALAASVLVSACGGGDAGEPFASKASIGFAVDGYLKDASVKCDVSGVVVKIDSTGFFRFPDGCDSSVSLTGGTNVDTLLSFTGTLKAPAGSKMVTPLTTLQVGGMSQNRIIAALGLDTDTDLANDDPALTAAGALVNPELFKKTLAVQQLLLQTTEALSGIAGDSTVATKQAIYNEVAAAFAIGLGTSGVLSPTATTVDLGVLKTLVTAATSRVAASSTVSPAVKAAVSAVNAESVAVVTSGAMQLQAEELLQMANTEVTAVTKALQSDTNINLAVSAPGMSATLSLLPTDAAVVAKATALTEAVSGGEVVVPPNTGVGTVVANFDTVVPVVRGPDSGGTGFITTTGIPAGGGTGAVLGVLRSDGQPWALNVLEASFQFAADRKTLSAKVYSPTAGIPMVMKVEGSAGAIEVNANETVVAGWQTLTWTYSAASTAAGAYNLLVILPNLGTVDAAPGKTYYFDDIKLLAAAGGGGGSTTTPGVDMGSGGPQTLTVATGNVTTGDGGNTMFVEGEGIFAVNYVGSAETTAPFNLAAWPNAKTANFAGITGIAGGDIGYFQDDANLSNSSQKVDEGGWVAGTALSPNGVPSFFRYFVLKGPVSNDAYMGLYANAPNNGTLNVSSFSKIKLKVWGPAPMFERTNFNPVLQVTLTGPKVAGCTTGSGGSEITQNLTANLKNGAGGFYTMPLSGFTVKGLCGTDSGAANVLAKLARVVVTVPGTSFNYTNLDGGNYATGVNLGAVGFTNN